MPENWIEIGQIKSKEATGISSEDVSSMISALDNGSVAKFSKMTIPSTYQTTWSANKSLYVYVAESMQFSSMAYVMPQGNMSYSCDFGQNTAANKCEILPSYNAAPLLENIKEGDPFSLEFEGVEGTTIYVEEVQESKINTRLTALEEISNGEITKRYEYVVYPENSGNVEHSIVWNYDDFKSLIFYINDSGATIDNNEIYWDGRGTITRLTSNTKYDFVPAFKNAIDELDFPDAPDGRTITFKFYNTSSQPFTFCVEEIKQTPVSARLTALENSVGDIETALDNIIAIQNELIGGESV